MVTIIKYLPYYTSNYLNKHRVYRVRANRKSYDSLLEALPHTRDKSSYLCWLMYILLTIPDAQQGDEYTVRYYSLLWVSDMINKITIKSIYVNCGIFNTSESYRKYNYKLFHPTWPGGKRWSEQCHPSNSNCSYWIMIHH